VSHYSMKKTLYGISIFTFLIVGVIVLVILAMIMFFVGLEIDDGGDEYFWGGEGNFADNEVPSQYISLYKKASKEYGLEWELLAAIHRVETVFSTINPMISHVGAEGHAQFMPCTWVGWGHPTCSGLGKGNIPDNDKSNLELIKKYGGYGVDGNGNGKADMWDLEDAIYSMANYLSAGYESSGSIDGAILQYNHSTEYLNKVKYFMKQYKSNLVTVDYTGGQNPDIISGNKAWVVPSANYVSSCFGPRWGKPHNGIDITTGSAGQIKGHDIVSFMDGSVSVSQYGTSGSGYGGYGWVVVIDHGNGLETLYAHMLEAGLPVGKKVKAGDRIGRVGNTSASDGYHLHFEIRQNGVPTDPLQSFSDFNLQLNPAGTNCPPAL